MPSNKIETRNNPFGVKTPEILSASEIFELFVPYPEFESLQNTGHQFLHGHRGSGKSMMLRMMEPECQVLQHKCSLEKIPYFGAYLSIKTTEINQPEYQRFEDEPSGFVLSEHVLTTKVLSRLLMSVGKYLSNIADSKKLLPEIKGFVIQDFFRIIVACGWSDSDSSSIEDAASIDSVFETLTDIVDQLQSQTVKYVRRRSFTATPQPYDGALLGFQDVLIPTVRKLQLRGLLPKCPVYLLLDDADNLTEVQTKILNTWVSYRNTDIISLKISTQQNYKTRLTSSGVLIEAPHDFSEIYFTSVQTGAVKNGYPALVAEIVERRLVKAGLVNVTAKEFFPEDETQSIAIKAIGDELKDAWKTKAGGGYRPADDAYRFARPEFIRRLGGNSKQTGTYRYAGFEQLVHISSGIIRFFLEPAAKMYSEELKRQTGSLIGKISPDIQDIQIRKQSDDLLLGSLDDLRNESVHSGMIATKEVDQLKNLILGMGYLFQAYLLDETESQRRIFSFFIADEPPEHLRKILELAVQQGYLYKDAVGRKEGMGRNRLYVLTRRLAPAFKLDPIGFSNYLSVTSTFLLGLLDNPRTYVNRRKADSLQMSNQLQLGLSTQEPL